MSFGYIIGFNLESASWCFQLLQTSLNIGDIKSVVDWYC